MMLSASSHYNPLAQLSRNALLYVLLVLISGVLLLSPYLPLWITAVGIVCVCWRLLVFVGFWSLPSSWQKALLVASCCGGLFLQYKGAISLDVFVALLMMGLSLKSLEVYHNKNAQLFLYVAILALMAYLLYAQGFIASVLALLQLLFIVAALVAINSEHQSSPLHSPALLLASLKTASLTLMFAIPLLLFLFTVMPRMAPLWAMPLQKQQARTGMSDEMHPGGFDQLTQSSELVLRAGFSTAIPPAADLYWRGVVLDEFDGARWKNQCDCNYDWKRTNGLPGDAGLTPLSQPDYRIVLEPHGNRWLFVLDNALLKDEAIWGNGENIFRYKNSVRERVSYAVWNANNPQAVNALTENALKRYIHIPVDGNLRAQALASSWRQNATLQQDTGVQKNASTEKIIQQALDYYHQSFFYTLTPPPVGKDSVDGFLFETRKGFCEHFASSFVFLMRAAGIPARVVMGYQGGQRNEENTFVTVRQFDAHAWAEVWQADKGWVRVDPTAAVAPERIALGFAEMFPGYMKDTECNIFSSDNRSVISVMVQMRQNLEGELFDIWEITDEVFVSLEDYCLDYLIGGQISKHRGKMYVSAREILEQFYY